MLEQKSDVKKKSKVEHKISIISPTGEIIGYIGSIHRESESKEAFIFECERFTFRNASIPEFFANKSKFKVSVEMSIVNQGNIESSSYNLDNCFIEDHSFCHIPTTANKVKIKHYKHPSFNREDAEAYEKWLESRFVW